MYDVEVVIADENLTRLAGISDYLFFEASRRTNQVGAMVVNLPLRHEEMLRDNNILITLEQALTGVSCAWMYALARHKTKSEWFLLGDTAYMITKPALTLEQRGNQFVSITGLDANHLLNARCVPRHSDDPLTTKAGNAADLMHDIFVQEFGPLGQTTNGVPDARRDWITPGCVADGQKPCVGEAGYEPRLNMRCKALDIMSEAADYSTARGTPLFFDMVPTINTLLGAGEKPFLPFEFNTYCDRRGADRTLGNGAGNGPVVLSPQRGTISDFEIGPDFSEDWTVSYGAGQGTGAGRPFAGPETDDVRVDSCKWGWWEDIATDNQLEDATQAAALAVSHQEKGQSRGAITATIQQTPGSRFGGVGFGGHYEFGDCVTLAETRKDGTEYTVDVWVSGFDLKIAEKQCELKVLFEVEG